MCRRPNGSPPRSGSLGPCFLTLFQHLPPVWLLLRVHCLKPFGIHSVCYLLFLSFLIIR